MKLVHGGFNFSVGEVLGIKMNRIIRIFGLGRRLPRPLGRKNCVLIGIWRKIVLVSDAFNGYK